MTGNVTSICHKSDFWSVDYWMMQERKLMKFWFTVSPLLSFLAQERLAVTEESKVVRYDQGK
jgi:hypothetical protein